MFGLILQVIVGILGLWLAIRFVPGVEFTGTIQTLVLTGAVLGLINFFLKPVLKLITLPLRLLTFGLFGLVINMGIIWLMDVFFLELIISGIISLFCTTIIIWGLGIILPFFFRKMKKEG